MALADVRESDENLLSPPKALATEPQHNAMDDLPVHPVRPLQAAFEESIIESIEEEEPQRSPVDADAERRRQKILEAKQYNDSWQMRWQQRASARYHPLLKLMAQITFGLHLLQQQQAKSDDEVVRILQTHVSEIDTFLQQTSEDLDLAIKDIEERVRFLKLPMEHKEVFEVMLEDKKFRTQLLEGNEKIQKVMDRTKMAMDGAGYDVHKALEATKELGRYLDSVNGKWPAHKPDLVEVVDVMRGNEQGWKVCMKNLQSTGNTLSSRMVQLSTQMREMSRLATLAAKRSKQKAKAMPEGSRSAPASPNLRSKFCQDGALPPMPADSAMASPTFSKAVSNDSESSRATEDTRSSARLQLQAPPSLRKAEPFGQYSRSLGSPSPISPKSAGLPLRPKTSDSKSYQPRDARGMDSRSDTKDLMDFFKQSPSHINPLRGNPPDTRSLSSNSSGDKPVTSNLVRSQSHDVVDAAMTSRQNSLLSSLPRSLSQNGMETASLHTASSSISNPSNLRVEVSPSSLTAVPAKQDHFHEIPASGFTRRISKRMKHIAPNPSIAPPVKPFAQQREASNSSSPTLRPSRSSSTLATNFTRLAPPSESEEDAFEENTSALNSRSMSTDGSTSARQAGPVQSPAVPPLPQSGNFPPRRQFGMTTPANGNFNGGAQVPRAFPATGGASIAETSASRRYRSLKRIFGRREEVGKVGA